MRDHIMDWLPRALVRLVELSRLKANWDSQGARPVPPDSLGWAMKFLELLSQCGLPEPRSDATGAGNVWFEWERLQGDLEVELKPHNLGCKVDMWDGRTRAPADSIEDAVRWVRIHATPTTTNEES